MENLKEVKTTVLGFLVIIGAAFYGIAPYFRESLWQVESLYVVGGILAGCLLLLAPDRIINWAFKWMDKKAR